MLRVQDQRNKDQINYWSICMLVAICKMSNVIWFFVCCRPNLKLAIGCNTYLENCSHVTTEEFFMANVLATASVSCMTYVPGLALPCQVALSRWLFGPSFKGKKK